MLVEFLIAFLPMLVFFLGLVQLSLLYTGKIVTQHAADRAARAASVVIADDPIRYAGEPFGSAPKGSARASAVRRAAELTLKPLTGSGVDSLRGAFSGGGDDGEMTADQLDVEFVGRPDGAFNPGELIKVRVSFDYECGVPIGRYVACGADSKSRLKAEASMPYQGASYEY